MTSNSLRKEVRRRLYVFANSWGRLVSDTRRQSFLREMIAGLVIANHVHLTKIARAVGSGTTNVQAAVKRLSRHLDSPHWSMRPLQEKLLHEVAVMIGEDSLIVADLTDIAKHYARRLEGLGRVRDGSDPQKGTVAGYMLFEAYLRGGRWQLFPLILTPLQTYSGAATSENQEILGYFREIHQATGGRGTWVLDRGFDRAELLLAMLEMSMGFIVRQRGDRHILTRQGRQMSVWQCATEALERERPGRWPAQGWIATEPVALPEAPEEELLLVAYWALPHQEPLMLLVSPAARRTGRTGRWFVRSYRKRWGSEDATRGIKQCFQVEAFLVRSWRSICRLMLLVALAFYWLNLWGNQGYEHLRAPLMNHPWRIAKRVTYLFNGLATQIGRILHPKPKIFPLGYSDTG